MKCCVLTRFVYEVIYMDAFIEHYVKLGFHKIIILYHDIVEPEVPNEFKPYVLLYKVPNHGNKTPDENKHLIPEDMDWVLHVDSDEFLLLHKRFPNISSYVNAKLGKHPEINVFLFMWSWVHKFDEASDMTLDTIFRNYKKMVGNRITQQNIKDNTHEVWVKSMFKRSHLDTLYIHCPSMIYGYYLYCNELIVLEDSDKIKSLIYRKSQDESHFYKDAVLMHVATRSLKNAIFKSVNIHKTQVSKKKIANEELLLEYLENHNMETENEYDLMKTLKDFIGYKIEWPLTCLKMNEIVINIDDYLRGQEYTFIAEYKDNYYKVFNKYNPNNPNDILMQPIFNNPCLNTAINRIINRFNIVFIQ